MTTREQLEAEAAELYPMPAPSRAVHIRAKTISAEQVEAAAEAYLGSIIWLEAGQFQSMDEKSRSVARYEARRVLAAAGFYIEEATDD